MSDTEKVKPAFCMTAGHRTDLRATALKLSSCIPNKHTDEHGRQWIGFTQVDFMRVMKLVAGVHLALETVETLEKDLCNARTRIDELRDGMYSGDDA